MQITAPDTRPASTSRRRVVFRTIALLYAFLTGLAMFGIPSVLTAWATSGAELPLRTHFVVYGALLGVLVPVAAAALAWRVSVAPAQQLGAVVTACLLGLLLAPEPENARYMAIVVVPAVLLLWLHPDRAALLSRRRLDPRMLAVTIVAAVPAIPYAVVNLRLSAGTHYTDDLHGGYAHAGILVLGLLGTALVASARANGWWVSVASVAVGTTVLGVAGILYPDDPSSVGGPGGVVALVLAGLFAGAAFVAARERAGD